MLGAMWHKIFNLFKEQRYLLAGSLILFFLLLAYLVLYLIYPGALDRGHRLVGRIAIKIAQYTGELETDQKGKGIEGKKEEEQILSYSLRRISEQSANTFRVVPHSAGVFSVEWKFSAYVVKQWVKKDNGSLELKKTIPMSEAMGAGRKFRFGGMALSKGTTGVLSATRFFFQDLTHSKKDWLDTKIVLESGDLFIGTIYSTPLVPQYILERLGGLVGKMINAYPLSLEDPSFNSVAIKSLSEKYGLVSLTVIFGPLFGSIMETVLPTDHHHILAFWVTSPRAVQHLAQSEEG